MIHKINEIEILNDVEELIFNIGISLEEVQNLYDSQPHDVEDTYLDEFIKNHEWLYIPDRKLFIQKDELEYCEGYSDKVKDRVREMVLIDPVLMDKILEKFYDSFWDEF